MKNHFKKQVEVQGMKKLDNIKGVQTLEAKDLKEIEGGWIVIALRIAAYVATAAVMYHDATCCKCNPKNCE
ncbi:hypothetical protein CAPN004_11620 [Capnocytophaga cynodegmi]|uniref:hypothetical protein n=1 Tax=Capnocytophaga cynodegmi TaxID=28189 RepID=UPI001ACE196D|nr:hypothetical protein [Capnocytophaga cynodegmi]GIM52132.1 hypothetical protein CAPN004_11620 [Capnocytophaga cynodegmi]